MHVVTVFFRRSIKEEVIHERSTSLMPFNIPGDEALAADAADLCPIRGNLLADDHAKVATQANAMCVADLKAFTEARKLYKRVAINMLQILVHWPSLKDLYGTLPRISRARAFPAPPRP